MRTLESGEITLTESENTFLQEHLGSESTASVTLIWIGDLLDYYNGQSVTFTVPDSNNLVLTADAAYAQSQSSLNYNWAGTINGSGYFMLNNAEGRMSGLIQTYNQTWTILPLREHYSLLVKLDMEYFVGDECLTPSEGAGSSPETDECGIEYDTCPAIIDVLLFATSDALRFTGVTNFDAWAQWGENVTNFAFERSDIPNKSVRFRWMGYDPNYRSNTDLGLVIDSFKNDNFVNQSLINYKADIAILVTNQGFFDPLGSQYLGIASGIFGHLNFDARHCVVEAPYFFAPTWTLPHELAHLMGARHNRGWNVPCGSCGDELDVCAHGYRFYAGNNEDQMFRTILAIKSPVGDGGMRILNFSNPDVDFLGEQTGLINNNNARTLRNSGCVIAGYAPAPEFSIKLNGFNFLCDPHGESFDPVYSASIHTDPGIPGIPPYNIEWWWNTSGVFTYQAPDKYLGSSYQIQLTTPPLACDFFFLHLKVTSADGLVRTVTKVINTGDCLACSMMEKGGERSYSEYLESRVDISPNPASEFINVEMVVEKQDQVNILLFDSKGKLIRDLGFETVEPGISKFEKNIEDIPPGYYWVSLVTESKRTNHPLVILK